MSHRRATTVTTPTALKETERIETLVASAIEAGWDEIEVREALSASDKHGVRSRIRSHLCQVSAWFPRHFFDKGETCWRIRHVPAKICR
jgi:hypothetical protein